MIKIVLDANQFISAIMLPKSKPAGILVLVRNDKVGLVVSRPILEEVRRVLQYPKIKKRIKYNATRIEK